MRDIATMDRTRIHHRRMQRHTGQRVEARCSYRDYDFADPIDLREFDTTVHHHDAMYELLGF
jgi:hypothetical protein